MASTAAAAQESRTSRWSAHPVQARALRVGLYLAPLVGSVVFVHFASRAVPAPTGSLLLFLVWWLGLSIVATGVLVVIDRAMRRLLPLAALLKLSLVFPDEAPSRFKVALGSGSVENLADRLSATKAAAQTETPSEAAARLLELVAALSIHDKLTRGHCERVRAYAVMIGEELGLTREELDRLNWAALLHDVGKLEVPGAILTKDGPPSDEEWDELRRHPIYGTVLVAPMRDWLGDWTDAVGYHHERWDGKGYPHSLAGNEIPLAGRIVAVADVFDVITSVRSYKSASAAEAARTEIANCAGSQFDPAVVRAFLNVSLGRMRFVIGPLSWLAHAPLLGRLPLTPGLGTLAGAFSVAATSVAGGLIATPPAAVADPAPLVTHAARPHHHLAPAPFVVHRTSSTLSATRPPSPPPATRPAPPTLLPPAAAVGDTFAPGDDLATVHEGGTVSIDVLGNDTGPAPLQLASLSSPGHGEATLFGSSVLYRAPLSWQGVETFQYQVLDGAGSTATANVKVEILPINHPPTFTGGGDVRVSEDSQRAGIQWATGTSAGDDGQSMHFATSSSNSGLFTSPPSLDRDGMLGFRLARDSNGVSQVRVTAMDEGGTAYGGNDRSPTETFALTVTPINDAPSFVTGGDVTVLEGAGPQARAWATAISPGPPNEAGQHVAFSAVSDNPSLFTVAGQPTVGPDRLLTFTAAPFAHGTARVDVTATDDGGTADGGVDSTTATFTITVVGVNQPPTISGGVNQSVLEDAGAQSVQWGSAIGPGAPDEGSQTVTVSASNDNPTLFSTQPAVSPGGVLTYRPAADANGSAVVTVVAHDDGGTANGGYDTTTKTFTITVTAVNDAPTFTGSGSVSVLENAGPQSLAWVTSQSPGPTDEAAQQIAYSTSNDNTALFTIGGQPVVAANGTLTFTPAASAAGSAHVTVTAQDDGGTANGGLNSTSTTFTVTITAVNQPPTFTAAGNQSALEDSGPQSTQWATAIDPGAPNESSQTVTFSTNNDNNGLFSTQPSISAAGVLSYTPAANTNGSATVTVTAQDDGGAANGGDDSTTATFTITVAAVNDPPTLTPAADQAISEDDGSQAAALTTIGPGPADESGQTVSLTTSTDHPEYFDLAGQPTVAADGTLTYTPALGAYGTAHVTITAQDNGGTANGGLDTASTAFDIVIAPLPPNAADDSYSTTTGALLHVAVPGVLANDADVNSTTLTVTAGTFATANGSVTIQADGSFDYQPAALFNGSDSFSYTITNGTGDTATGTVTISVTPAGTSTSTLYLSGSGLSSEVWDLAASAPAPAAPVPDWDSDGNPGLTIKDSGGKETNVDSRREQTWTYETGAAGLLLDGPLTLHLTAATEHLNTNKAETIWLYIYDCPGGLATAATAGCTNIGSNKVLVPKWNTSANYSEHDAVAAVNALLAPGRQLRIRLLIGGSPIWIPLVSPTQSSIDYSG